MKLHCWGWGGQCEVCVCKPAWIKICVYLILRLLRYQLNLLNSPFWVRFLRMWPFFNPTIEVVTFRLRGYVYVMKVFMVWSHRAPWQLHSKPSMPRTSNKPLWSQWVRRAWPSAGARHGPSPPLHCNRASTSCWWGECCTTPPLVDCMGDSSCPDLLGRFIPRRQFWFFD